MRLICVTGMHRSGTSLVARVLNLLGVAWGPEEAMMAASEANPRGYWEIREISDLDEEIIARLGGRWHRLPGFAEDWQHAPEMGEHRRHARDVLREMFGDPGDQPEVAGFKDPRLSVLLPFWRTVADVDATVLTVRHPDEVVASVRRRDGFAPEKAAGLWIDHTAAGIANDPGRSVVTYRRLLADPVGEATRLAGELGLPEPDGDTAEAIAAFADPDLRRATDPDVDEPGPELAAARSLYGMLEGEAGPEGVAPVAERLWAGRNDARVVAERVRTRDEQLRDARTRQEQLEARRQQARDEARRRAHELAHARRTAERWHDEYERLRNRRSVRAALSAAESLRPAVRAARRITGRDPDPGRARRADEEAVQPHEPASEADARALADELARTAPGSDRTDGPLVSILVLNRDGEDHLRRLLDGLASTTYRSFELIVVDNDSSDASVDLLRSADVGAPVTVLENDQNVSFSAGNNQAAGAADGRLLLLLNNDVEPATPGWLGRMVDTLEGRTAPEPAGGRDADGPPVAVGARLVYPRRPGLEQVGDTVHPDLTLQHRGVHLDTGPAGLPRGRNLGAGEDPTSAEAAATLERPAVTAACMLLRAEDWEEVGGLTDGYRYGTEDVDLCLKLRAGGGRIVYDGQAVCWHHEFGTQNERGREVKRRNRLHNRELFASLWGPRVFRTVMADKIADAGRWSLTPLHVAITVTKDDPSAGYGDWYTAHELGGALEELGWQVSYVERYDERWYDLARYEDDRAGTVDVLIVLLDAFDLHRLDRRPVTVAWVRNWTHRWMDRPWFEDYDLVLASSGRSQELIEEHTAKQAHRFPLATNPERFRPGPDGPGGGARRDAVFAGNHWDEPRAIVPALRGLPDSLDVAVHGSGWDEVDGMDRYDRGPVDYDDLPEVYRTSRVVVDDTAGHTKPYNAVNSRVFDGLAAGAVVVSDNPGGVGELFDEDFPTWEDAESLAAQLQRFRENPDEAARVAGRYRETVLAEHTYQRRAEQLRDVLAGWVRARRVSIAIGVPDRDQQHRWGDLHFARDLQDRLEAAGRPTRVLILPEWEADHARRDDVAVHLLGLSEWQTSPGQLDVLWNISHPELATPELVDRYDLAFTASESFADELDERTSVPVRALAQATDPDRFRPDPAGAPRHELLFVGNSRRVRRRIIDDLTGPGLDHELAIYGADWTPELVDQRHVAGDHVDNDRLASYYAAAAIVLNDHWDDMREHGFLSNRLYDALAAGAFVISDHVDGIEEAFDGAVVTYRDRDDLHEKVDHYLQHPGERAELADRGRRVVLERHTFAARAATLLEAVDTALKDRPGTVDVSGRSASSLTQRTSAVDFSHNNHKNQQA